MDKFEIMDNADALRFAIDDLETLWRVMQDAVDREDGGDLLTVAVLALQPIVRDLRAASDGITAALKDAGTAQKCQEQPSES